MDTKKLSELKKLGFEGNDVSLAISLDEYGLAWATNTAFPNDWHFCYKQANGKFVWGFYFAKNLDVKKEFDWIKDWRGMFESLGAEASNWFALPVTAQISDLINYWETENVMGSSYQEGWDIDFEN